MRKLFAILFLGILLLGCVQLPGAAKPSGNGSNASVAQQLQNIPAAVANATQNIPAKACTDTYSFSSLGDGTLSKPTSFTVTATCASGKAVTAYVDGVSAGTQTPSSDSEEELAFSLVGLKDGTSSVDIKSDGTSVYSKSWAVKPLGYTDTSGLDNDPVSIKQWKAVAFDVGNTVSVRSASFYMKRLNYNTMADTDVIVELRADSGGKPASAKLASATLPITGTTLSENWAKFDFGSEVSLPAGKYWLVMRVDQPSSPVVSDAVYIHCVAVDKLKSGNAYHGQMDLTRDDDKQVWVETTWQPLAYDRKYSFKVSAE